MATLVIELNKANAVKTTTNGVDYYDWKPALQMAAQEVVALNTLASPGTSFPRPIETNPASPNIEGFLGVLNSKPTDDGMVTVRTDQYEWINVNLLPAPPTTFSFILGTPKHVGGLF
jgi:hypothetical protein